MKGLYKCEESEALKSHSLISKETGIQILVCTTFLGNIILIYFLNLSIVTIESYIGNISFKCTM